MEINLLKYFTVKRFFNALKIFLSFNLSRLLRIPVVWGMPLSYSIEPTNHCNLRCPECPSGLGTLTRPSGLMKFDFFKDLISDINSTGFYLQLFFQGEPYINKCLPEMIKYARGKNMYVSVSTNGQYINKNNVDSVLDHAPDKMILSIDGLDEESYQNYRIGGTFARADEGLQELIRCKKERKSEKPFVELQFIVMKQNEHLLDEVIKYGEKRGVDKIVFKTMQVSSYQNALHFLPEEKKYRRYEFENDSVRVKGRLRNHCFALWRTSVITWDGRVVPCCFDKDADFELGKINGITFNKIWKSDSYQSFRQMILNNRKAVGMCSNCTEGMKMNILEAGQ